jgi:hypothetical protein
MTLQGSFVGTQVMERQNEGSWDFPQGMILVDTGGVLP